MSSKHFVTNAEQTVLDALEALAWADPSLGFDRKNKSLINQTSDPSTTVSLFSGGGAGHEPAHAGYIGNGMLAGAISGSIFASPSVAQIVNGVTHLQGKVQGGGKGVLLIVKNYTGDVLHFNLAASKLRTAGIPVEVVVIGDDVSVGRAKSGRVGRRGLAGTVFVHKIAGAAAAKSASLKEVAQLAAEVNDGLVTVGASLDHVHVPGRAKDDEGLLADDELELGMGIHNEPGSKKLKPVPELGNIVKMMLEQLLDPNDKDRAYLSDIESGKYALMVNNLGGLSVLELGAIAKEVATQLHSRNLTICRFYIGTFMTSLNGPGFSITLLKTSANMLPLLDAPTSAPGWAPKSPSTSPEAIKPPTELTSTPEVAEPTIENGYTLDTTSFKTTITAGCKSLIAAEPQITKYDTIAGDGDCGETLKNGAEAVIKFLENELTSDAVTTFAKLADLAEESMGGTSGALYSIFLHGATSWFRQEGAKANGKTVGKQEYVSALQAALVALQKVTPARIGDRTMMDSLEPFIKALGEGTGVAEAAKKAREGTEATKSMTASLGRAVYVGGKEYQECPDPGAEGCAVFFEGAAKAV